jgi:tRNA A-37 threonylcarbamoyl transferase component Bud32
MGDSKLTPDLAETEAASGAGDEPVSAGPEWRAQLRLADRYVLRRFLGKGGMGQVWVAFDEVLDKEVALKRVRADVVAAAQALESLRREVSLAQTVTHVNVCRIYDLEPLEGDWVIKMEVIGGRSLAALLEETPALPIARAQQIARQLADGLAAVHAVGVVHRDLKPHNVIIDDAGRAVLMDFGIARTSVPTGDTVQGRITGTPEYMAPEQARGEKVDARVDLYALGCVLYRMLAGEVPFPAATRVAAMARHLTDPPPDARKRRAEVPAWLARLAKELMAKSPERRPGDAAIVRDRLSGPPSRAPRVVAAILALSLVVTLVIAGVSVWRAHVRDRWRPELADLPAEYDARSKRTYPSPDGTHIAFDTRRNDEVRVMAGPVVAGGSTVTGPPGYRLLNWTHDSRALLVADKKDQLFRFGLDDRRLEALGIEAVGAVECGDALFIVDPVPSVGPNSARLVVHQRDRAPRELFAADARYYIADLLACDGRRVAYTRYDFAAAQEHLFVRDLDAPAPFEVKDLGGHQFIKLGSFTDRDTIIVNALDGKTTHVWELPMHGGRARQLGFGGDEFLPTVTHDGRLFFETFRSTSALFARAEGQSARRLTFGDERVTGATPTPDGRAIILTINRAYAGDEQLVLHPLDDGPEQILAHAGEAGNLVMATRFVGDDLYYQSIPSVAQRAPLMAWSYRDGRSRQVRELPDGYLVDVADGFVHLGTEKGALRLPLDDNGAAVPDAPKPWHAVIVAPRGGWRLAMRWDKAPAYALFAPGAPLDGEPQVALEQFPRFSGDGAAVVFARAGAVVRRELASGKERVLAEPGDIGLVVETADGKTLFYTQVEQYVRRQVMTNFADRPPL